MKQLQWGGCEGGRKQVLQQLQWKSEDVWLSWVIAAVVLKKWGGWGVLSYCSSCSEKVRRGRCLELLQQLYWKSEEGWRSRVIAAVALKKRGGLAVKSYCSSCIEKEGRVGGQELLQRLHWKREEGRESRVIAEIMKVNSRTIRNYINYGELPVVMIENRECCVRRENIR